MVQTPQVQSQQGLAALPQSSGKAVKGQAGDAESFANLLHEQGVGVTASGAGSATESASKSPGMAATAPAANAAPQYENRSLYPAGKLARLPLAAVAKGDPGTGSAKQVPAMRGSGNSAGGSANTKSGKSVSSADSGAPASPVTPGASSALPLFAAQLQAAFATPAGRKSRQGGRLRLQPADPVIRPQCWPTVSPGKPTQAPVRLCRMRQSYQTAPMGRIPPPRPTAPKPLARSERPKLETLAPRWLRKRFPAR